MLTKTIRTFVAPLGFALLAVLFTSAAASASDWTWSITPYVWGTNVTTDVSVNDRAIASKDIDFSDLVDVLDLSFQGHVEGQRGKNGVMLDVFYVHLADDDKRFALPPPLAGEAIANGDLKLTIAELGGLYNPRGDGEGFALLYGARVVDRDVDVDARFDLGPGGALRRSFAVSETLYDALLGVRYVGRFSPRWTYQVEADASAGGTKLAWNGTAGLGYTFGESGRYTFLAGYRHMDLEFEKDHAAGQADVEATLSGFISGLRIRF